MLETYINRNKKDINDWKQISPTVFVHRYDIIGTPIVKYIVYVETSSYTEYSSTTSHEGKRYGDLETYRDMPELVTKLPYGSDERCKLVDAWYGTLKILAHGLIKKAFPEDFKEGAIA